MIEIIGYLAGILTTLSFLPQAILSIKTKNTDGISIGMYSFFVTGVSFWLIYGILIENFAIILANIITLPLAMITWYIKLTDIVKNKKSDL
jgi:MtN3 and saliva related transmembrane protein